MRIDRKLARDHGRLTVLRTKFHDAESLLEELGGRFNESDAETDGPDSQLMPNFSTQSVPDVENDASTIEQELELLKRRDSSALRRQLASQFNDLTILVETLRAQLKEDVVAYEQLRSIRNHLAGSRAYIEKISKLLSDMDSDIFEERDVGQLNSRINLELTEAERALEQGNRAVLVPSNQRTVENSTGDEMAIPNQEKP
jgi:hypothetical protein